MGKEQELRPCPFCGSPAEIEHTWIPRSSECLAICSNPHCVAHNIEQDEQGGWCCDTYNSEADAIAAWNRRAPAVAAGGVTEALRSAMGMCEQYADFIRRVPAAEIEQHPYLPELEQVIEVARAHLAVGDEGMGEAPKGWKWELVPDYPTGDVVAACICGSWPGGECLRCPPIRQEARDE